jgi:GT2 family glycosyltransferase
LDNPKKITPAALNLGITHAKGAVIVRMDAHVEYPADYISSLVRLLQESGADNVGGVCRTLPANGTALARAIAFGMSHPLGVGNSYFRIGSAEPRWVDTVPFGCYRREVFERIGLFDEQLVRNQDDELNFRLIKQGGRIRLSPKIVCRYYARESLGKLWRMYYQYGYFKPLVVRKVRVMTLRQLAPPALVLGLLITGALAPWSRLAAGAFAAIVLTYAATIATCAAGAVGKVGVAAAALFAVIPVLHLSYGLGYLQGVWKVLACRHGRPGDATVIPISR